MDTSSSAARFDFSNPFFAATIIDADNTRYPLWTKQVAADLKKANLKHTRSLSFLQEVVIENNLSGVPKITATLAPPYRDAINFLDSKLMEWGNTRLEVVYGYVSNSTSSILISKVYSGILLKPDVQLGADVTITLNAQGVSSFSAIRQAGTRTFENVSRKDIIRQIAEGRVKSADITKRTEFGPDSGGGTLVEPVDVDAREGIEMDVLRNDRPSLGMFSKEEYGSFTTTDRATAKAFVSNRGDAEGAKNRNIEIVDDDVSLDSESSKLYNQPAQFTQGGRTDWQAIAELCKQCQLYMLWIGTTLTLTPQRAVFKQGPHRVFRLFDFPNGAIGPASGVFPILSASSPNMAVYLPGASRGQFMSEINSGTREVVSKMVGDEDTKAPRTTEGISAPGANEYFPSTDSSTGDGATTVPGDPSDEGALGQARSAYLSHTTDMGVALNIDSFADPTLVPGHAIGVMGLGVRLEGVYIVFKQTITLGGTGATMSLETRSNSSRIGGQAASGPVAKAKQVWAEEASKVLVEPSRVPADVA